MKRVSLKLARMRKPDLCVVYPRTGYDRGWLIFQGKRLIGMVHEETGKAVVNYAHGSSHASWILLEKGMKGREEITLDRDTITAIKDAESGSGDRIGGSVFIA
mgnify:CR=1 FL=1